MRKLRNFSTNRCYHLISRVANKAFYFTDEERGRFVERIGCGGWLILLVFDSYEKRRIY